VLTSIIQNDTKLLYQSFLSPRVNLPNKVRRHAEIPQMKVHRTNKTYKIKGTLKGVNQLKAFFNKKKSKKQNHSNNQQSKKIVTNQYLFLKTFQLINM
jgi:hypothetical protein